MAADPQQGPRDSSSCGGFCARVGTSQRAIRKGAHWADRDRSLQIRPNNVTRRTAATRFGVLVFLMTFPQ